MYRDIRYQVKTGESMQICVEVVLDGNATAMNGLNRKTPTRYLQKEFALISENFWTSPVEDFLRNL